MPLSSHKESELEKKLSQIRTKGADAYYAALAKKLGLPFSDLTAAPVDAEALMILPETTARQSQLAVILKTGKKLLVAVLDPESEETKKVKEELVQRGFSVDYIFTTAGALEKVWQRYSFLKTQKSFEVGAIDINEEELASLQSQITNVSDLRQQVNKIATTQLLEILIAGALKTNASDIHFEPEIKGIRLRYRLDGVLNDIANIDSASYKKVLNRIKVLSKLKLNVSHKPQDGRFTIREGKIDIEVRVSVLPSEYGETIVMRLLDPRTIKTKLEDLGMRAELLTFIKSYLDKPTGAILTTGPTGSGKTTTLYAFIEYLNSPGTKIITIEDPIEYHIEGISQTQVNPDKGYDFSKGLRAIVRQDPDIILVGEIRDSETADIALQAALTGHLVLSTIHTNDAAGTVPRLIDLKIRPQVIAPAIRVAMAQRLLRRLCSDCRKETPASVDLTAEIKKNLEPVAEKYELSLEKDLKVYEPGTCKECNETGYKGRIGVYEAFPITPTMEKLIMTSPAVSDIQSLAVSEGMTTMTQDAYMKLLGGITSGEEIKRILG